MCGIPEKRSLSLRAADEGKVFVIANEWDEITRSQWAANLVFCAFIIQSNPRLVQPVFFLMVPRILHYFWISTEKIRLLKRGQEDQWMIA